MAFEFRLPDVGEGIDAAEIVRWLVGVGDTVAEDDALVEVQTDKATVELPSPYAGTVLRLGGAPGDLVAVGELLAIVGEPSDAEPAVSGPKDAEPPASGPKDAQRAGNGSQRASSELRGAVRERSELMSPAGRPLASPAVRRAARELGVDLATVVGSGPQGRILRQDLALLHLEEARPQHGAAEPSATPVPDGLPRVRALRDDEVVPLRGTRRVIAQNMARSWRTIPHIIDFREAEASALASLREKLNRRFEAEGRPRVTLMPILAKIASSVVRRHRSLNASFDEEHELITYHGAVHLGVATSAAGGLVVPVLRDADQKTLVEIADELAMLADAARHRKLSAGQLTGATFTVNNYGALGSTLATPIIAPGQSANLGFGKVTTKPVVRGGEIVARQVLPLSCSGDHRVMDGLELAAFCNEIVSAIEDPALLLADLI
jgi:pyruvate/2-oxoglutarate dehydrogenase complex dihydrolipoamide acyltransferase (E2) component